ncbi:MAG: hypothetical protein OEZ06_16925 [Myxococcales bacterium]|nr:hypothetical protein [Myxococcales bacterium]
MNSLAVLLLATPIYGLSLQAPTLGAATAQSPLLSPAAAASLVVALDQDVEEVSEAAEDSEDSYAAQMKRRNSLADLHRPLGMATWAAMTATVGLGFIQYYNLYGFFDDRGSNPCVTGDAIFGQGQCHETPWPHAIGAILTTGLYATTFTIAALMPDPDDLASGKGEFASTLRLHKLLRWVHFGGMVAQALLGLYIANDLGLDRANDYDTLQTLATAHLAAGLVTWGAMTWAGALMTF